MRTLPVFSQTLCNMTQNTLPCDIKDCDSNDYKVIRRFGGEFDINIKMAAGFSEIFYSFQVKMAVIGFVYVDTVQSGSWLAPLRP